MVAIKRICDRCGAEINPRESASFVQIKHACGDMLDKETELCVSCKNQLKRWLEPIPESDRPVLVYPDGVR